MCVRRSADDGRVDAGMIQHAMYGSECMAMIDCRDSFSSVLSYVDDCDEIRVVDPRKSLQMGLGDSSSAY